MEKSRGEQGGCALPYPLTVSRWKVELEQECCREMVHFSYDEEINEYSGIRLGTLGSLLTDRAELCLVQRKA